MQCSGSDIATLTFTDFDTEGGFDYVRVDTTGDGSTDTNLHGTSIPAPVSGGSTMLIEFDSDGSVQGI